MEIAARDVFALRGCLGRGLLRVRASEREAEGEEGAVFHNRRPCCHASRTDALLEGRAD
jgi:hypothetical protein